MANQLDPYDINIAGRKTRAAGQFRRGGRFTKKTPVGAQMLKNAVAKKGMPTAGRAVASVAEASIPQQIRDQIKAVYSNKQIQKYGGIASLVFMLSQIARGAVGGGIGHFAEMEAMEQQADLINPEAYYQRAMLPQLQEQERSMKNAVLGRLASGGVLGPSLAPGEYSIGG